MGVMPELPEVQNTVNGLRDHIRGQTIAQVWTDYHSPHYYGKANIKDPAYFRFFRQAVVGTRIVEVSRRAKQIFISLDSGQVIAVHMKMTGHFLVGRWDWHKANQRWEPPAGFWDSSWELSREEVKKTMPLSDPYNNFIHLMCTFEDGQMMAFSDMRTFGTISLLEDNRQYTQAITGLGPEPLARSTTLKVFVSQLHKRPRMMVKPALLDQSLIAGFGNIYSDEVLWSARVHPESRVGLIPPAQWQAIYQDGKKILRSAIKHGGDSMGDYRRVDGRGGTYQGMHQVYQREGQACSRCGGRIEKKLIGARIGRYCPACQALYT